MIMVTFLSHCATESLCGIIQFIFCYQTLFSGLISAGLRHFANNSTILAGFLVIEMRTLLLSLIHQIGGCAGQNRFEQPRRIHLG